MTDGAAEPIEPIAVVGLACRFPGARDAAQFWANLAHGVESISFYSEDELRAAGVDPALLADPRYVRSGGGVLEDVERFDPGFFGIDRAEAALLDPQHRLFLECVHEALEVAGYDPSSFPGAIGLFAGVGGFHYLLRNVAANPAALARAGGLGLSLTNEKDFVALRASYLLDLRGPSIDVQTACSTSLVATHLACQSLLNGECEIALAGGASIHAVAKQGYLWEEGGIFSRDGRCRAFDARASGMIGGDGVGVVVLKRLEDALADGDTVRAVIRGTAINNDGAAKVGFLAPGVDSQRRVVREALGLAAVDARSIGYVEAHGTGTPLGDMIEIAALTDAFRADTDDRGFCAIGSVKTNIGHANTAAGIAALIKTVLALEHRTLPPSLHYEQPNPEIDFASSPFFVNTARRDWPAGDGPRRAGVHALAIGGTNAHVVLEEAPPQPPAAAAAGPELVVLSARSEEALEHVRARLAAYLQEHPALALRDVAFTLQVGRRALPHRCALVAQDRDDALRALQDGEATRTLRGVRERSDTPVVLLVADARGGLAGGAAALHAAEPAFAEALDACAESRPAGAGDPRDVLVRGAAADRAAGALASFALGYALARLWTSLGVQPAAYAGDGIGALVAACLRGERALDAALREAAGDTAARPLDLRALRTPQRRIFLEVGATSVLAPRVREHVPAADVVAAPPLEPAALQRARAQLWLLGAPLDWSAHHAGAPPRRVPLPTYPFERERCWIEPSAGAARAAGTAPTSWLYRPGWQRLAPLDVAPSTGTAAPACWLLCTDEAGLGRALAARLRETGARVVEVAPGARFARLAPDRFELRPADDDDYGALARALAADGGVPSRVVDLWSVRAPADAPRRGDPLGAALAHGLEHLRGLADALAAAAAQRAETPLGLTVVTDELFDVLGGEASEPARAAVLGAAALPAVTRGRLVWQHIDVQLGAADAAALARLALALEADAAAPATGAVLAYRGSYRWVPAFAPAALGSAAPTAAPSRTFLVLSGALDARAHACAALARTAGAPGLLLLAPAHPGDADALRAAGGDVLVETVDAGDAAAVQAALARAEQHFGAPPRGIHHTATPSDRDDPDALRTEMRRILALGEALRGRALDFLVVASTRNEAHAPDSSARALAAFLDALADSQPPGATPLVRLCADDEIEGPPAETALGPILAARPRRIVVTPHDPHTAPPAAEPREPSARTARADALAAPESDIEKAVAAVWQDVLGLDRVGVHENFFAIGGRSLTGTRVVARLRQELHVALPIRQLFESPTIAELARVIEASRWLAEGKGEEGGQGETTEREEIEL